MEDDYRVSFQVKNYLFEIWEEIWTKNFRIRLIYPYDFEVDGNKSQNGEKSGMKIYFKSKMVATILQTHGYYVINCEF